MNYWNISRSLICGIVLLAFVISQIDAATYDHVGCWRMRPNDRDHHNKVLQKEMNIIRKDIRSKEDITNCSNHAKKRKYSMFAVHNATCFGSPRLHLIYMRFGKGTFCKRGLGGKEDGDFYSLIGTLSIGHDALHTHFENQLIEEKSKKDILWKRVQIGEERPFIPSKEFFEEGIPRQLIQQKLSPNVRTVSQNDGNLLINPSFEYPIDKSAAEWTCQGQLDDTRGGIFARTTEVKISGSYSGICTDRIAQWAGPGQYIGSVLHPGKAYIFTAETMLPNAKSNELDSTELWLRYKPIRTNKEEKKLLGRRDKFISNDNWQHWNAQFVLPTHTVGFAYVFIYFSGPPKGVDIIIDNASLKVLHLDPLWKERTDKEIDRIRKRDVYVRVRLNSTEYSISSMKKVTAKVRQIKSHFGFGCSANHASFKKIHNLRQFCLNNFEWATMESELKWKQTEAKRGELDYQIVDDMLMDLTENNFNLRGQCIYWELEAENPTWLPRLPEKQFMSSVVERVESLVSRYVGKFQHWDVDNEILHGEFYPDHLPVIGERVHSWMFKRVNEIDPMAAIFLNDLDVVGSSIYTQAYFELAKKMKDRGDPISHVGVEGHFTGWVHPAVLKARLDIIAKAGLPIWLTEIDVYDPNVARRADSLENIMRVAMSHPTVHGMVFWTISGYKSWRGNDAALMDGKDAKINLAGEKVESLRQKWQTNVDLKPTTFTDNTCEFFFRGFFGEYDITIEFPDGQKIREHAVVSSKKEPLVIEIDTKVLDSQ